MKEGGKIYETITSEGAGHAFMRQGGVPEPEETNRKAMEQAWTRWLELLKKLQADKWHFKFTGIIKREDGPHGSSSPFYGRM